MKFGSEVTYCSVDQLQGPQGLPFKGSLPPLAACAPVSLMSCSSRDDIGPPCALSLACQAYLSCSVKSYFFLDLDSPWLICCARMPPSCRWSKNLTRECPLPPARAHLLSAYLCISCLMPCVFRPQQCSWCSPSGSMSRKTGLGLCHLPPLTSCTTSQKLPNLLCDSFPSLENEDHVYLKGYEDEMS